MSIFNFGAKGKAKVGSYWFVRLPVDSVFGASGAMTQTVVVKITEVFSEGSGYSGKLIPRNPNKPSVNFGEDALVRKLLQPDIEYIIAQERKRMGGQVPPKPRPSDNPAPKAKIGQVWQAKFSGDGPEFTARIASSGRINGKHRYRIEPWPEYHYRRGNGFWLITENCLVRELSPEEQEMARFAYKMYLNSSYGKIRDPWEPGEPIPLAQRRTTYFKPCKFKIGETKMNDETFITDTGITRYRYKQIKSAEHAQFGDDLFLVQVLGDVRCINEAKFVRKHSDNSSMIYSPQEQSTSIIHHSHLYTREEVETQTMRVQISDVLDNNPYPRAINPATPVPSGKFKITEAQVNSDGTVTLTYE